MQAIHASNARSKEESLKNVWLRCTASIMIVSVRVHVKQQPRWHSSSSTSSEYMHMTNSRCHSSQINKVIHVGLSLIISSPSAGYIYCSPHLSFSLLADAMAQIRIPNTALATKSEMEQPICSARCSGTTDAHHLDDVDTWVCEPGDDCQVAGLHEESTDTLRVLLGGSSEANHKVCTTKAIGNNVMDMAQKTPAGGIVVLDLARIADGNHESGGNSKLPCQVLSLLHWQSHDQDQLDQKQRDSQEPVDVTVGIMERCTRQSHGVI